MINEEALHNIRTKMVLVTPQKANRWLQSNTKNRDIAQDHVNRLASDMSDGKWMLTHQGIAFNCDGTLLDGQHRLLAIVRSDTSQWMAVTNGLPVESVSAIDDHRKRSVKDSLKIVHGVAAPNMNRAVAAAAWMADGVGVHRTPCKVSRSQQESLYLEHAKAIAWAIEEYPTNKPGLGRAVVLAVIARAFYSASRVKLARFCKVLADTTHADGSNEDKCVLRLREYLTSATSGGSSSQQEAFRKVERVLSVWLKGGSISKITEVNEEMFPTPTEKATKTR